MCTSPLLRQDRDEYAGRFSAAGGPKGMQCNLRTIDLHVYNDVMG